jgi:hypothetical protein
VIASVVFQSFGKCQALPDTRQSWRGIGASQKDGVIRVLGDLQQASCLSVIGMAADELQQLLTKCPADAQFVARTRAGIWPNASVPFRRG